MTNEETERERERKRRTIDMIEMFASNVVKSMDWRESWSEKERNEFLVIEWIQCV